MSSQQLPWLTLLMCPCRPHFSISKHRKPVFIRYKGIIWVCTYSGRRCMWISIASVSNRLGWWTTSEVRTWLSASKILWPLMDNTWAAVSLVFSDAGDDATLRSAYLHFIAEASRSDHWRILLNACVFGYSVSARKKCTPYSTKAIYPYGPWYSWHMEITPCLSPPVMNGL